jgi:GWxTD domain-containing protein
MGWRSTLFIIALTTGCAGPVIFAQSARNPAQADFFAKARLIMVKEEEEIWRHLPDDQSRQEFIDEFWSKRDPTPGTPENECRDEFERRIAYANRWFRENRASGQGWNTERGRILLQLGQPDQRSLVDMTSSSRIKAIERWIYQDFNLYLEFVDKSGFGELRLNNWPAALLTAIDLARFSLNTATRPGKKRTLSFTAGYHAGKLILEIPLNRIAFQEKDGRMTADLAVTCHIYRNYLKVDRRTFSIGISENKDELLQKKKTIMEFPLELPGDGNFNLDVILEEPVSQSRYRVFCSASK